MLGECGEGCGGSIFTYCFRIHHAALRIRHRLSIALDVGDFAPDIAPARGGGGVAGHSLHSTPHGSTPGRPHPCHATHRTVPCDKGCGGCWESAGRDAGDVFSHIVFEYITKHYEYGTDYLLLWMWGILPRTLLPPGGAVVLQGIHSIPPHTVPRQAGLTRATPPTVPYRVTKAAGDAGRVRGGMRGMCFHILFSNTSRSITNMAQIICCSGCGGFCPGQRSPPGCKRYLHKRIVSFWRVSAAKNICTVYDGRG